MPSAARTRSPRWASLAEAAVYSRVPRSTLRRWIAQGLLPANRLGPRRIEVDLNDLNALRQPIPTAATVPQTSNNEPVNDRTQVLNVGTFERAENG